MNACSVNLPNLTEILPLTAERNLVDITLLQSYDSDSNVGPTLGGKTSTISKSSDQGGLAIGSERRVTFANDDAGRETIPPKAELEVIGGSENTGFGRGYDSIVMPDFGRNKPKEVKTEHKKRKSLVSLDGGESQSTKKARAAHSISPLASKADAKKK